MHVSKLRYIPLVSIVSLYISCYQPKSVTQELSLKQIERLVKQDTLWENVISVVEEKLELVSDDRVLQAKYKDLTYGRLYNFYGRVYDSIWLNEIIEGISYARMSYLDSLKGKYQEQMEADFKQYKEIQEETAPHGFFTISYDGIQNNYYEYIDGVESVIIRFRITPLRGPIQGGSFKFYLSSKVTGNELSEMNCRFSSYTSKPTIYSWELDYDLEQELEYFTSEEVRNRYDFDYTYLSVRQYDVTFSAQEIYERIPDSFLSALKDGILSEDEYLDILSDAYDLEVHDSDSFSEKYLFKRLRAYDPLAYQYVYDEW